LDGAGQPATDTRVVKGYRDSRIGDGLLENAVQRELDDVVRDAVGDREKVPLASGRLPGEGAIRVAIYVEAILTGVDLVVQVAADLQNQESKKLVTG
jgi:hypothetical protein